MPNPLQTIGTILVCYAAIYSTLPCSAQTIIRTNVQRPKIVRPATRLSSTNFSSKTGISQSSRSCFQIDANSRMYVRDNNGGIRYYAANNSSSYSNIMSKTRRCN